jgi:hypothetical protein
MALISLFEEALKETRPLVVVQRWYKTFSDRLPAKETHMLGPIACIIDFV